MSNPSPALLQVEDTLRSVIQTLIDGQEGFRTTADELKSETLRNLFLAESLKRAEFRGALETLLHQEGVHDIDEIGTVSGALHRAWGDIKAIFADSDRSLLATAEQAEDAAVKTYTEALQKELPLPVRQILSSQSAHIQTVHDSIKSARDIGNLKSGE